MMPKNNMNMFLTRNRFAGDVERTISSTSVRRANQRSDGVHAAVLQAAASLVSEKGYLNVTIEAIAARRWLRKANYL